MWMCFTNLSVMLDETWSNAIIMLLSACWGLFAGHINVGRDPEA